MEDKSFYMMLYNVHFPIIRLHGRQSFYMMLYNVHFPNIRVPWMTTAYDFDLYMILYNVVYNDI